MHVVRCFEDENIIHVDGSIDPRRDIEVIDLELVLADLETVERRTEKARHLLKNGDKLKALEADVGERLRAHLEAGKPARTFAMSEEEREIVRMNLTGGAMKKVSKVITPEDIVKARSVVEDVYMDEKIEKYIVDIIFATREPAEYSLEKLQPLIAYGGSPRASISLAKAARAYAFIRRRGYVIPEDVRAVCHDVLRHRIGLTYEAEAENISSEQIITEILNNVIVP